MAIIGEIIKRVIDINGLINQDANPCDGQKAVLRGVLDTAKNTAIGRSYRLAEILRASKPVREFKRIVPKFDYDKLHAEWWHYLHEGHQNITWPGGQRYFAKSSGTTGNSKVIPVTDDMLNAIKQAGIQQILSL